MGQRVRVWVDTVTTMQLQSDNGLELPEGWQLANLIAVPPRQGSTDAERKFWIVMVPAKVGGSEYAGSGPRGGYPSISGPWGGDSQLGPRRHVSWQEEGMEPAHWWTVQP